MGFIILDSIIVLILNIPFGYWRANVRKLSLQWILAIHIPVPLIIMLRILTDIGFQWYTFVILIAMFFLGQQLGTYIHKIIKKGSLREISSCLIMDLKRMLF